MLAVSRFHVEEGEAAAFVRRAHAAVAFMAARDGCESAELLRNLDDADLWVISSRWRNVGSYRRAFNGYDAKVVLVALLSEAIDEPSAYDRPEDVGENQPRAR